MLLVEEVAFHTESDIQRLEDGFHATVLTQRNRCRKTIGQTQLEIEMAVAPAQVKQGIEFLKVVIREQTIQVAVFKIERAAFCLEQTHLILQVQGLTAQCRSLKTKADIEVVGQLIVTHDREGRAAARSACIIVLAIGP